MRFFRPTNGGLYMINIGFIGLGQMGLPMFRNLKTNRIHYNLVGYDRNTSLINTLRQHTEYRSQITQNLHDLRKSDIVITMLPHGKAVQHVLIGENGLAPLLAPHSIIIDMSSSSPLDTASLERKLARYQLHLADAPVSGSIPKAKSSDLTILLGCKPELIASIEPVLLCMGTKIIKTGPVGSAHTMKSLNNYVYAAGLLAAAEVLLMGEALNLDLATLVDVLNASSGRNIATETKLKQHMLEGGDFNGGFHLALMAKDLHITYELHNEAGFLPKQLALCHELWQKALQDLPHEADNTEIFHFLKKHLLKNEQINQQRSYA